MDCVLQMECNNNSFKIHCTSCSYCFNTTTPLFKIACKSLKNLYMKTIKVPLTITNVKEKKKILIATVPADGHFNPLTGIAKFLENNGYDVAWYTSDLYRPKLNKLGIRHYSFKKALDVN